MKFTKMQGAGNDYVYINCFEETIPDRPNLARRISDRNFGVGSDGLICIGPSDVADISMDMYNADGSQGLMCGNGIRCVGKYAYDKGLVQKDCLTVETLAGIKTLLLQIESNQVKRIRVNMGAPSFLPADIPVLTPEPDFIGKQVEICSKIWTVTALSVGNPHAVVFTDIPVDELPLERIGPVFESHPLFPERINTEFVNVLSPGHFQMRVWERGSGETLACGTGATAVAAAATLCNYCDGHALVKLRGGELEVSWERDKDNCLYLTGPAEFVFEGDFYL